VDAPRRGGNVLKQLFTTKSLAAFHEQQDSGNPLRRLLPRSALTTLGVGAIIGTGIFVLTGTAAANYAGPAVTLSFVIAGIGCSLAALCYAEFAAMIPVAGSAYSYSYATLGEIVGWFVGWNLMLEYMFAAGMVSAGWSGYVLSLLEPLGIHIPSALAHPPFDRGAGGLGLVTTGAYLNLPAVLIVAILGAISYVGIRQSSAVNFVIVTIKVAVVLLFVLLGMNFVNVSYWHPYIPANAGTFGHFGWSGVMTAAGIVFTAYLGFDALSTCAQEASNPQRDMPFSILLSLAICTVLYIATATVLTGMVHYRELDVAAPVAIALDSYPALRWLGLPVKIGAIAGMSSVILVLILAQSRVFFAMAQDGLLPSWFGRVHRKFHTPSTGTVATATCAAAIGGLLPVQILGELCSIGTLIAFIVVCIGVLALRKWRPELPRPFRVPLPWFTCVAGAVICGGLMLALPRDTWLRLALWTVVGLLVYALYGYRHSRLHGSQPPGRRESSTPQTCPSRTDKRLRLDKPYCDVPGTIIFDMDQSRRGYHLNMFCVSLTKPANRARFKAAERACLDEWPMSEEQKRAVLARDYNGLLALGGNIYFLSKLFYTDGKSFVYAAAIMTGMSQEQYAQMMLNGGRTPQGNRYVGETG
jgi:APA family basic amino acid/polyamine antiporter